MQKGDTDLKQQLFCPRRVTPNEEKHIGRTHAVRKRDEYNARKLKQELSALINSEKYGAP